MEVDRVNAFKGFERMGVATSGNWQRGECVNQDRLGSGIHSGNNFKISRSIPEIFVDSI